MIAQCKQWHDITEECANTLGRALTADDVGTQVARVRIYNKYDYSFYYFQCRESFTLCEVNGKELRVARISPREERELKDWNDGNWATVSAIQKFLSARGFITERAIGW